MNDEQLAVLPEAVRDWDEAKNSETPEIFWDRLSNLRSKMGTGLFQPGQDAGNEDWGKFARKAIELSGERLIPRPDLEDTEQRNALYSALGRPESAEGYEFAEIEGSKINDDRKKFVSEIAFELGLTKSQLKALDSKIREAEGVSMAEANTAFTGELDTLKQEWGLLFEERVHAAKKIAATFFPHIPGDTDFSAAELRAFQSLAKQFGEGGKEFRKQGEQNEDLMTPTEAAEKINEMRGNKEHPYNNPQSPGHNVAKKRMRELYLIKNNLPAE